MMRALPCLLLCACYGSGPLPQQPAEATVVFAAPLPTEDQICNGSYIGDVAIGAGSGFATLLPYVPTQNNDGNGGNCNNGGGIAPVVAINVFAFDKTGADVAGTMVGQAGQSNGSTRPRLAADGTGVAFAFSDEQQQPQNAITIMSTGSGTTGQLIGTNSPFNAVGIVADATALYIAGTQQMGGGTELGNPEFPCCAPVFGQQPSQDNQLGSIPLGIGAGTVAQLPVALPGLFDIPLKQSLVATDTSLIVIGTDMSNAPIIESFPKAGGSATMLGTLQQMMGTNPIGPAGLAADSAHVAWSATFDPDLTGPHGCFIWAFDLTQSTMSMLLSTQSFSCMDLAVDATSVYFAIFTVGDNGDDQNNNGNNQMSGIGIGRVSITDSSNVEAIALGFSGLGTGPRRIYLDGDDIYAVDPLVIGKIPKSALDGQHDFSP